MANNSLTQRVLSAKDRGLTDSEIAYYENIPVEDVENIITYWGENLRGDNTARVTAARNFLRSRGTERVRDYIEQTVAIARMEGRDVRKYTTAEVALRYRIDSVLARDVVDEMFLAMDNLNCEQRAQRRDVEGMVNRLWQ